MTQWLALLLCREPLAERTLLHFALATALLCATSLLSPWQGKSLEWFQYGLLGAVLPLAAVGPRLSGLILDLSFALLGGLALTRTPTPLLIALVGLQILAVVSYRFFRPAHGLSPRGIRIFLFATSFAFFARLSWLRPITDWLREPMLLLTLAASTAFCWSSLTGPDRGWLSHVRLTRITTGLAFLFFALAAFNHQQLYDSARYADMHNWGVYLSPVILVRQGGWLLWDVPSQYGFLSTLAVAALPVKSPWQAMYVLNALLQLGGAWLIFTLLRRVASFPFALLATWAAVFLISGYYPELLGPQSFPSTGALRFIWVATLAYWVAWSTVIQPVSSQWRLRIGTLLWFLGTLWSAESAFYCSATWFPCCALLARTRGSRRFMLLPPALLAAAFAGIELYYRANLGHGPDWFGFHEYLHSFHSGAFSTSVTAASPVWIALVLLSALAATLQGKDRPRLLAGTAIFFAAWSVTSYFMGRGHANKMVNLSANYALAFAYLLRFPSLRPVGTAYFTIVLALAFVSPSKLEKNLRDLAHLPATHIEQRLPRISSEVAQLMEHAQLPDDAAILSYEKFQDFSPIRDPAFDRGMPLAWLPLPSFPLLAALKPERSQLYLLRFAARRPMSGWLLKRKDSPLPAWISDPLHRTHRMTKERESPEWTLSYWEPIR